MKNGLTDMTHIAEATVIHSPPERSQADLLDFVSRLPTASGGNRLMRLTAGPTPSGLQLKHDVEVQLNAARDVAGLEYRVGVSWQPTGTRLLPSFTGLLRFQWDENYGNTWLVIEGNYEPPLGAVGRVFDAVIGEQIARNTLRALLDELRVSLEAARSRELGSNKP